MARVKLRGGLYDMSKEFIPVLMKEIHTKEPKDYIFNHYDRCYIYIKDIIEFEDDKGNMQKNYKYIQPATQPK